MATIGYLGNTEDTVNRTVYTFTGVSIGAASADRRIVVVAVARSGSAITLSSMTIGGISATKAVDEVGNGLICSQSISIAAVPTGTTATIVVTMSASVGCCSIFVYTTTGITSDTATDIATSGTTIDVIKGGLLIAFSSNGSGANASWSEVTEDYEANPDASEYVSGGSLIVSETRFDVTPVCTWTAGSGNLVMASFPATTSFTTPSNAYVTDNTYATLAATSGILTVEVSKDGGSTYGTAITKTFGAADTLETYGNGSTELWGLSFTRASMVDANFRVRVSHGIYTQVYKTFGFATGSDTLTGIEIAIEAKYATSTISIDLIKVKIYYGTSVLPVQAGSQAYASNGRKNGEGVGVGTGVLVFHDGTAWRACDTGATVAA